MMAKSLILSAITALVVAAVPLIRLVLEHFDAVPKTKKQAFTYASVCVVKPEGVPNAEGACVISRGDKKVTANKLENVIVDKPNAIPPGAKVDSVVEATWEWNNCDSFQIIAAQYIREKINVQVLQNGYGGCSAMLKFTVTYSE
jgi:hypothetical protein